jgi:hypothetical protein
MKASKYHREVLDAGIYEQQVHNILVVVCNVHNLTPEVLKKKTRVREVIDARYQAIALIKHATKLSLISIGSVFGGKDHSTVIHALQKHQNYLQNDKNYASLFAKVQERLLKIEFSYAKLDEAFVAKRIREVQAILFSPEVIDTEFFIPYKKEMNILLEMQECFKRQEDISKFATRKSQLPAIYQSLL